MEGCSIETRGAATSAAPTNFWRSEAMPTFGILTATGALLAVFGAVVLIKFPDRPGGRIAWRGLEISSTGAGLPMIVIGVGCLLLAALRGW
jgi:hypothetical protein